MLKAFVKIWLLTLLSQAETCYASITTPQSILFSHDLLYKNAAIQTSFYLNEWQYDSEQSFFSAIKRLSYEPESVPEDIVFAKANGRREIKVPPVLWMAAIAILVSIVIFQWIIIQRWKLRTQNQKQQLTALTNQLNQTHFQLESNMAFSTGLFQQIQQHRSSRESLLMSLSDDIADPVSVIQTSFIGWLKMSRLNDVMLEKARLIEKSVERIERFLKHARYSVTSTNKKRQETWCDLDTILKQISEAWNLSVHIESKPEQTECLVKGDETAVVFILTNIINELNNLSSETTPMVANIEKESQQIILGFGISQNNESAPHSYNNQLSISKLHPLINEITTQSGIELNQPDPNAVDVIQLRFQCYIPPSATEISEQDTYIPPVVFEASQQPVLHQPGPKSGSPKCLVVESSPEMQVCIVQAMKEHFCCKGIFNSVTALQQVKEWQPDIIISELQDGNSDGFDLIRELKQNSQNNAPPILILTNRGTTENKLKALELDIDGFLEKPFSEELLLKTAIKVTTHHQGSKNDDEIRENVKFQQSKDAIFLAQLNSLIEKHIANTEFKFEDYFCQFAMSKRQFFRRVNNLTRCTPKQYLIQKRLELARHLLRKGVLLDDVTQRCGFKDQQSLMKVYEAHFGEEIV